MKLTEREDVEPYRVVGIVELALLDKTHNGQAKS
jgi:hypothetical protein